MPPVSAAQRALMWIASKKPGGVDGVSQSVGKEFANADPGGKLPARVHRDSGGGASQDLSSANQQDLSATFQNNLISQLLGSGDQQGQNRGGGVSRATGGGVKDGKSLADHAYKLARKMAREQEKLAEPHFDVGGSPEIPYFEKGAIRNIESADNRPMHGFINSAGPGRTDTHPAGVASGSYVIPADVISGTGEGNSAFGANVIQKMLSVGPYGTPLSPTGHAGRGIGIPRPPEPYYSQPAFRQTDIQSDWPPHFDKGGIAVEGDKDEGKPIPVALAGGEFVIGPSWTTDGKEIYKGVKQIGGGDLSRGHRCLDQFVLAARKKSVKDTAALPPPKKSHEK